jgi:altronate dehydratase large subunit
MADQEGAGYPGEGTEFSCIIRFRKEDNVGIALADLPCSASYPVVTFGEDERGSLHIPEEQPDWSREDGRAAVIPRYHKVATADIPRNAAIIKDGTAIGVASADIRPGHLVDQRPEGGGTTGRPGGNIREYPNPYQPPAASLETLAAAYSIYRDGFDRHPVLRPREENAAGDRQCVSVYPRADGTWGSRNHLLIIPSVFCVNQEAAEIADMFRDTSWGKNGENAVIPLTHQSGCCQAGFDEEVTLRTLTDMACHPNVGGVIVVTLGCSPLCVNDRLYASIRAKAGSDTTVHCLRVQQDGRAATIREGTKLAEEMIAHLRAQERRPLPLSGLCLAVKCGGSDPSSGLFANSAIGHVADWLLDRDGTVVISEIMEFFGAERILRERCRDHAVWLDLLRIIKTNEMIGLSVAKAAEAGAASVELTPGNIRAGLSTQEEKSLGAIRKMGSQHPIENVVPFGERITGSRHGLYVMDGPGQDLVSASGLAAAGSQAMLFSTGIGTPLGSAITPVIKITGNADTFARHRDFIDICIPFRKIVVGGASEKEVAEATLLPGLLAVIEGKKTRAELNRHRDFAIRTYTMVQ